MTKVYEIIRSNRKSISIQVMSDGRIIVRCPNWANKNDVMAFVESKSTWIHKHLAALKTEILPPYTKDELDFLRSRTKELVTKRVEHYASIMNVSYKRISVRAQKTRWGSCSTKGNLSFNCLLALVPPDVLDYVVVHELCHLKEMNHSSRFWDEVQLILPDYEISRKWLRVNGGSLIDRIR